MIFTQEAPLTQKWFSGRSYIQSNWNLEMLVLRRGENPEKNLSEQNKEPTKTNLTHVWPRVQNRTRATLVGGECYHHYAIPATLLVIIIIIVVILINMFSVNFLIITVTTIIVLFIIITIIIYFFRLRTLLKPVVV